MNSPKPMLKPYSIIKYPSKTHENPHKTLQKTLQKPTKKTKSHYPKCPPLAEEKDRDRDRGEAPPARQTSEERRAMIASWNAEKDPIHRITGGDRNGLLVFFGGFCKVLYGFSWFLEGFLVTVFGDGVVSLGGDWRLIWGMVGVFFLSLVLKSFFSIEFCWWLF